MRPFAIPENRSPPTRLLQWLRSLASGSCASSVDHAEFFSHLGERGDGSVEVLAGIAPIETVHHWTYRELFRELAGVDPFTTTVAELRLLLASTHGIMPVGMPDDLDTWLDLVMTHVIEPLLGAGLAFVCDYPASQAALARLRPGNPPVAARFEVYLNGVELANGFHELADAVEQQQRFELEAARRRDSDVPEVPMDRKLLDALAAGLPDCAGVALGIDRLVMLFTDSPSIRDVLLFPYMRPEA